MTKVLYTLFFIFLATPILAEGTSGHFERYELETQEMLEALSNPENWQNCAYKKYRLGKELTTETPLDSLPFDNYQHHSRQVRHLTGQAQRHGEKNKKGKTKVGYTFEVASTWIHDTTYVSGHITSNMTWDTEGSPYIITGDVYVDEGCTLTIEPGVDVLFRYTEDYLYSIIIDGRLFAVGTTEDTILFSYKSLINPLNVQWGSIWFRDSTDTTSRVEYCKLVYGYRMIICDKGSPRIINCSFHYNPDYASVGSCIYTRDGNPIVQENYLTGWSVGVSLHGKSHLIIKGNIFDSLGYSIVLGDSTGGLIENNRILQCNTGIFCTGDSGREILITHNLIRDGIYSPGIYINHCAAVVKIYNNTIVGNGNGGIHVWYNECSADIRNNIFSNNSPRAITADPSISFFIVRNNLFYGDTMNLSGLIPEGFELISISNFNGDSCDTFYNLFEYDPLFIDSTDFHLQEDSPCIDAGDPTFPLDPDSTIADIGAYFYNHTPYVPEILTKPQSFILYQNYPNPFNTDTKIKYIIPKKGLVNISIYSITGTLIETIVNQFHKVGSYETIWEGKPYCSGVYLCKLEIKGVKKIIKLLLIK